MTQALIHVAGVRAAEAMGALVPGNSKTLSTLVCSRASAGPLSHLLPAQEWDAVPRVPGASLLLGGGQPSGALALDITPAAGPPPSRTHACVSPVGDQHHLLSSSSPGAGEVGRLTYPPGLSGEAVCSCHQSCCGRKACPQCIPEGEDRAI